jgi:homoserine dehydrogenase
LHLHGADLYNAAEKAGVDLYYEAAVAGAIPIIRPLRESLIGDRINRVMGIVNGTTNFILTKMDEENLPFEVVLKEAQALGYAEADPTADVEGHDAAAKAAILAGLAFHTRVTANDVACEGITKVSAQDVATAKSMNKVIKLIAEAKRTDAGISVRVAPMMLDRQSPIGISSRSF